MNKLRDDHALTVEDTLRLDEALEAGKPLAGLLKSLDDSTPSLAWRSELNQKLLLVSKKGRRSLGLRWVSGFAAVAAVTLVAFVAVRKPEPRPDVRRTVPVAQSVANANIEESLVKAHFEADMESGLGFATVQSEPPYGS